MADEGVKMARFYHLRYDRTAKEAQETATSISRHLKKFGLPSEVKVVVDHSKRGYEYELKTRATPKQITLLHDLLNRDPQYERKRYLVSKSAINKISDPKFKKHLSVLRRKAAKSFKTTQKKYSTEFARISATNRGRSK